MSLSWIALALWLAAPATDAPARPDAVTRLPGEWSVTGADGKTTMPCGKGQRFKLSADGRHIELIESTAPAGWMARYLIIRREPFRVLMMIEDEERLTEQGDPVLWWAHFDGQDSFRWRRYDWDATSATAARWQRCPA